MEFSQVSHEEETIQRSTSPDVNIRHLEDVSQGQLNKKFVRAPWSARESPHVTGCRTEEISSNAFPGRHRPDSL